MATLVLGALGTLVGGPLGGAIGAIAGRQIDAQLIGSKSREGPRIKDLAVTTSSYGTPIPQHFGRMRAAGTIIWSTELTENRETSGGGKGQPKTTSFSYTTSFAVALSSRPIAGVGRIWADGNLLRGAAGDLKTGGTMRVHLGRGGQAVDPLIASAQGAACPAFRGCAYVVFENLDLTDFGNRIPALTFEIIADQRALSLDDFVAPVSAPHSAAVELTRLEGFSYEGGPLANTLATIDTLYPLVSDSGGERLSLRSADGDLEVPILLPEASAAWEDGDFGSLTGQNRSRSGDADDTPGALRYYDVARDFQPGVQRADGRARAGRTRTIEFPGAMAADDARALANAASQRNSWIRESMAWRVSELDPAIAPGTRVRVPQTPGTWQVTGWEWRERGVELELLRLPPVGGTPSAGDSGALPAPPDLLVPQTILRAFELPWDGRGPIDVPAQFAAASASNAGWNGAALYVENAGQLNPLGGSGRIRSVSGTLADTLVSSAALLLERGASIDIDLVASDLQLGPASAASLANGSNRMLVGGELIQFAIAEQLGPVRWRLRGLLRGRGGTEAAARAGHTAGALVTLIDDSLVALDPAKVPSNPETMLAAIGRGDESPVSAPLENAGLTLKPPSPVHPRIARKADGSLELCWTRRARGAWEWRDEVETPLVEQTEAYRIGIGPTDAPAAIWESTSNRFTIAATDLSQLSSSAPGSPVWVRQIGSFAQSDPLLLTTLA